MEWIKILFGICPIKSYVVPLTHYLSDGRENLLDVGEYMFLPAGPRDPAVPGEADAQCAGRVPLLPRPVRLQASGTNISSHSQPYYRHV